MFAMAALRRLLPTSVGILVGQSRGVKGKVLRKGMWDGWPRYSPDGWPYARFMKRVRGEGYMSKQAVRRAKGQIKGALRHRSQICAAGQP